MIIFNQAETAALTPTRMQEIYTQAKNLKRNFQAISVEDIIDVLDQLSLQWSKETEFYQRARAHLVSEQVFSDKIIDETLQIIPTLICR
jgi:hypothetical protein